MYILFWKLKFELFIHFRHLKLYTNWNGFHLNSCCIRILSEIIVLLTRNKRITTMHVDPSITSPIRIFFRSLEIDMTISNRVVPTARIPSMSLICDAMMSIDTAEVNPEFTGPEMKSIKKPATNRIVRIECYNKIRVWMFQESRYKKENIKFKL